MALESTDIDQALESAAQSVRSIRAEAINVKQSVNRGVSSLAQFATTYADLISAVADLAESSDPVDRLQVAKLAKIQSEATDLYVKISAVKAGIDQLGL